MTTQKQRRNPISTKGFAWGKRRVELDLSLRELAELTGLNLGDLSRCESGRMVPTGDEYAKVTAALEAVAKKRGAIPV